METHWHYHVPMTNLVTGLHEDFKVNRGQVQLIVGVPCRRGIQPQIMVTWMLVWHVCDITLCSVFKPMNEFIELFKTFVDGMKPNKCVLTPTLIHGCPHDHPRLWSMIVMWAMCMNKGPVIWLAAKLTRNCPQLPLCCRGHGNELLGPPSPRQVVHVMYHNTLNSFFKKP